MTLAFLAKLADRIIEARDPVERMVLMGMASAVLSRTRTHCCAPTVTTPGVPEHISTPEGVKE